MALYYLWRTGEVMTHHRENFERVYALAEAVAPAHLTRESDEAEANRSLIKKEISLQPSRDTTQRSLGKITHQAILCTLASNSSTISSGEVETKLLMKFRTPVKGVSIIKPIGSIPICA